MQICIPNTKEESAVKHDRQKKTLRPLNAARLFFTRLSLSLDMDAVLANDGQGSSIPLIHRVEETFSARFAWGWGGRRLWLAWGVSARCWRK